jgi:aminoglycoside/choline kinase family phosphotransferase
MHNERFDIGLERILGHRCRNRVVTDLPGGASNRTYHRIEDGDTGSSWVVMVLADEPIRSEEASAGPKPDELPFYQVQHFLSARGVPVPHIHYFDREQGHLWLDDLGDIVLGDHLTNLPGPARVEAYKPAVDLLVQFQEATRSHDNEIICFQRQFEPALLRWELDHYREWRLESQLSRQLSPETSTALADAFDDLVAKLSATPQILCHRDFQSRNLMPSGDSSLVLIDFQDALLGPYCYDLVALTRDSYIQLSLAEVDELVRYYLSLRPDLDPELFRTAFDWQTVQRKLKDAGRFVYIDQVKGNSHFLPYIEPSLSYVRRALERTPSLTRLAELLAELDPDAFA